MNMDSQVATDAAAFGEGFGLRDTDDTDVPAPTVEPKADPTPKVDPAPTEDTTDYKALYEKEAERLRALQGKYNAEVPRLHAELKEVKEAAASIAITASGIVTSSRSPISSATSSTRRPRFSST